MNSPVSRLESGEPDFAGIAQYLFSQPLYSFIYIALFIGLGFHLYHAFQSAFQTLGLDHKTYTPYIRWFAIAYAIVIPSGFIIIPLYFLI